MKRQRKFVIEINKPKSYIKEIYKTKIGYFYLRTNKIENAKQWRYKKNCENSIETLSNKLDPTKTDLKKYELSAIEITDKQTLRGIKLEKLNKV